MLQAQLYFLSDQYYQDFPDDKLMKNKDTVDGVNGSVKSRQWKKASPCRIIEPHEEVLLCPENTQK